MKNTEEICRQFGITGVFACEEEISTGNVNRTFRICFMEDEEKKSYILQQINTYAFCNSRELMENIGRVTAHLRGKNSGTPILQYYNAGLLNYYAAADGTFWRLCDEIPSVTYDRTDDPKIIFHAGQAFGAFQKDLSDFKPSLLHETIPDFHNTRKRYASLEDAVKCDELGRVSESRAEIEWLLSVKEKACALSDLQTSGVLPLHVTHNDTKLNNLLFDKMTHKPLTVIDLDTVMPGLIGYDFGDAIRSVMNCCQPNDMISDKIGLNVDMFCAFAEGFLSEMARNLSENEAETLALSCFAMTCELAVRYLDDYFRGDRYFKTKEPKQNLSRVRRQIALAKELEEHLDEMNEIIQAYMVKYKNA